MYLVTQETKVPKKIFYLFFCFILPTNAIADDEVLMRMYERLEMIRTQMQQLTEENQSKIFLKV